MKNRITDTRTAARTGLALAVGMAFVLAGSLASVGSASLMSSVRRRITDRRDRGALSLEQAIVTAVLSAAAIALGVAIVNAVVSHQNQIK